MTNNPSLPVTQQLADFVSSLDWDAASPRVRSLIPLLLVDIFRAAAIGSDKPWTHSVEKLLGGPTDTVASAGAANGLMAQQAALFYSNQQASPAYAAFINGTACGSLDWDDSHVAAIIHPGICVWPAALAVAEAVQANGRQLLTAVLAGYEVAIRIGMAIQPEHSLRGFQGTPTCGVFGAAAASAKLLQLSAEQTRNALGIAASFACGISQFFVSGSDIKRIHAGKAAANGVEAAFLANAGLSGPHDAIEGVQGFGRAFSDRFDPERALENLGHTFPTEWISLKTHVGSVRMQAAIEAAGVLARSGVAMEDVASIEIGVHRAMIGKLTANQPINSQHAQLSTPFAVAMAMQLAPQRSGPFILSIDDYDRCLNDEQVRDLSARIECAADPDVERLTTAESVPARVTCLMRDGRRFEQFIEHPKGCPQNPLTPDEIFDRFKSIAGARCEQQAIETWLTHVRQLESLPSIKPLLALRPR
ncbi:MAG TPA: MmgE/PrpD family protein [Eoetvoesiella sp.]